MYYEIRTVIWKVRKSEIWESLFYIIANKNVEKWIHLIENNVDCVFVWNNEMNFQIYNRLYF